MAGGSGLSALESAKKSAALIAHRALTCFRMTEVLRPRAQFVKGVPLWNQRAAPVENP